MSGVGKWLAGILAAVIASVTAWLLIGPRGLWNPPPKPDESGIVVPDTRGLVNYEAYRILQKAGVVVRQMSEPSATIEACRVLRTEPPPGGRLVKGAQVVIIISSGDPQSRVHYGCPPPEGGSATHKRQ